MDKTNKQVGDAPNAAEIAEVEHRREVLRKLGKFAVYAAPLTLVVSANAQQSGSGGGGRTGSAVKPKH